MGSCRQREQNRLELVVTPSVDEKYRPPGKGQVAAAVGARGSSALRQGRVQPGPVQAL